eukprot:5427836-Pyramimonas_sp.AAC.1
MASGNEIIDAQLALQRAELVSVHVSVQNPDSEAKAGAEREALQNAARGPLPCRFKWRRR